MQEKQILSMTKKEYMQFHININNSKFWTNIEISIFNFIAKPTEPHCCILLSKMDNAAVDRKDDTHCNTSQQPSQPLIYLMCPFMLNRYIHMNILTLKNNLCRAKYGDVLKCELSIAHLVILVVKQRVSKTGAAEISC